jgi:hypothetical protein
VPRSFSLVFPRGPQPVCFEPAFPSAIGTEGATPARGYSMLKSVIAEKVNQVIAHDRRKSSRSPIEIPIEVSGFDRTGRFHTERTSTHDITDSSCSFHLKMEVENGMVLAIRVMSTENGTLADPGPVLFYVSRVDPNVGAFTVGAVKLAPRVPWKIDAADAKPQRDLVY